MKSFGNVKFLGFSKSSTILADTREGNTLILRYLKIQLSEHQYLALTGRFLILTLFKETLKSHLELYVSLT